MSENPPDILHAPWRLEYLEDLEAKGKAPAAGRNFLRQYWLDPASDANNHVVVRTADGLVMLNRYPYANGHLLAALGEPAPRLLDYPPPRRAALWALADLGVDLIERTLQPQGVNIGVNQGRAGGAGLPEHVHVHIVPRWGGDVNFMTTVGHVRVIPSSLEVMAARFRDTYARMAR